MTLKISLPQFIGLLKSVTSHHPGRTEKNNAKDSGVDGAGEIATKKRALNSVHLHHTWRPTHAQFRGAETIDAIARYHTQNLGWSDIAQHLTIDPVGGLWLGRDWRRPPASASGNNGSRDEGPFMIELIGDFDDGKDQLEGAQLESLHQVLRLLVSHMAGDKDKVSKADLKEFIKPHCEMTKAKSCPGTSLTTKQGNLNEAFVDAIFKSDDPATKLPRLAPRQVEQLIRNAWPVSRNIDEGVPGVELPEENDPMQTFHFGTTLSSRSNNANWNGLERHIVNTAFGQQSNAGNWNETMSSALFEGIRQHIENCNNDSDDNKDKTAHLLLYAHGGLVSERNALDYAAEHRRYWIENNIYPIFFIWETGWWEVIAQKLFGRRDITDISDRVVEKLIGSVGRPLWSLMKESAFRASQRSLQDGSQGGAYEFVQRLNSTLAAQFNDVDVDHKQLQIHAVGHSAGSIYLGEMLEALGRSKYTSQLQSMNLLAPAISVERFNELVKPDLGSRIKTLNMYTMDEGRERDDDLAPPAYFKSLLYLIAGTLETQPNTPILGLQESIRADDSLSDLKSGGLFHSKSKSKCRVFWASDRNEFNYRTDSRKHGDFDNDASTLDSVAASILGFEPEDHEDAAQLLNLPYEQHRPSSRGVQQRREQLGQLADQILARPVAGAPAVITGSVPAQKAQPQSGENNANPTAVSSGATRRALCVGINDYPTMPLKGCVNDSRSWGRALDQLGFEVDYLTDAKASRDAILQNLRSLIQSSVPGDVIVFQYAGHGTQFVDLTGDESDGFDEAFVPHDYQSGQFLLDDDFRKEVDQLPAGVNMTFFMDCCHSGSNSRFAPVTRMTGEGGSRPRFLPPTEKMEDAYRASVQDGTRSVHRGESIDVQYIHFAACMDSEYAYEQGNQGDFTRIATALLDSGVRENVSSFEFINRVRQQFGSNPRQHPQLLKLGDHLLGHALLQPLGPSPNLPPASAHLPHPSNPARSNGQANGVIAQP